MLIKGSSGGLFLRYNIGMGITGFLSTREVAEGLGITVRRVRVLIEEGALSAERAGRDWQVRVEVYETFKSNRRGPGRPRTRKGKG